MATFTNSATLSYNGRSVNSNTTVGTLNQTVEAAKTALKGDYTLGEILTYIVSATNTGTTAAENVTLTDNLGSYTISSVSAVPLTYVEDSVTLYTNGTLSTAPTVTATSPLTVTGITIPAGGNVLVIYQAVVNGFAPLATGSTISNTATFSGDTLGTDVSAVSTENVSTAPILAINKALSPTTVSAGEQVTYTFVIQNSGNTPADAADAIILTDTFNPALENITVSYNGTQWTAGTQYTYDQASGLFTTASGVITVPAATYTQNADTGIWTTTPGSTTITVTGTV